MSDNPDTTDPTSEPTSDTPTDLSSPTEMPPGEDIALGPADAATSALSDALEGQSALEAKSITAPFLSGSISEGLSDPSNPAQGGWIVGRQEIDPYTNMAAASGMLSALAGHDVDAYTGEAKAALANANAFADGYDIEPYYGGIQDTATSVVASGSTASPALIAFSIDENSGYVATGFTPGASDTASDTGGSTYIGTVTIDGIDYFKFSDHGFILETRIDAEIASPPDVQPVQPTDSPQSSQAAMSAPIFNVVPSSEPTPQRDQIQFTQEITIQARQPFDWPISDPATLDAVQNAAHFQWGDAVQLFKGGYNGLVNSLPILAGPLLASTVEALDIPKAKIDPRYGGAALFGEKLAENLVMEAAAEVPALGRVLRLAAAAKAPAYWFLGAGGLGGSARAGSRSASVALEAAEATGAGARRAAIAVDELGIVAVVTSKQRFRTIVTALIRNPSHPLHRLLNAEGKLIASTSKGMTELVWFENPNILEAGHYESAKRLAGAPDRLVLMSAYENRLLSATLEHPSMGGEMLESGQVLSIGGVPMDLKSAAALVEFGLLDADIFTNAPLVAY